MPREPTLNEVIAHYGWTTEDDAKQYKKRILDSQGEILFRGDAHQCWEWLEAKGLYPIPP